MYHEEVILPGVERIVEDKVEPLRGELRDLREEMRAGFAEMRQGFKDGQSSIRVLAGGIAELKVREEDQEHEERIRRLEVKAGVRSRA